MKTSIVTVKSLKSQDAYRIDSEFWEERLIQNEASIHANSLMRDLVEHESNIQKLTDTTQSCKYLEISDVALHSTTYQLKEIHPGSIPDRAKYLLQKNDVAVSTVRPIRNAVALIDTDDVVGSSGFAILRSKNVPGQFLWAFCKTNYFRNFLVRRQRNSMYPAVTSEDVMSIPVFTTSSDFQRYIALQIQTSNDLLTECLQKYRTLQREVLDQMGIQFDNRSSTKTIVRSFSHVRRARRFDAKYFDPNHSMLDDAFESRARTATLEEIAVIDKGVEVGKEQYIGNGIPFVRVSDVGRFNLGVNKRVDQQVYDQFKAARARQGDLLLTKDASLGMVHHVYYKPKPMLISSGIVRLRIRDESIPTYYLAMVLDTPITTSQIERESSGSNISHWNIDRVRNCRVPLLSQRKMNSINDKVRQLCKKINEAQLEIFDTIQQVNRHIGSG